MTRQETAPDRFHRTGSGAQLESAQVAARRIAHRIAQELITDGRAQTLVEMFRESGREGGRVMTYSNMGLEVFPEITATPKVRRNAVHNVIIQLVTDEERIPITQTRTKRLGEQRQRDMDPKLAKKIQRGGGQALAAAVRRGDVVPNVKGMVEARGRKLWNSEEINFLVILANSPRFQHTDNNPSRRGRPDYKRVATFLNRMFHNNRSVGSVSAAYKTSNQK